MASIGLDFYSRNPQQRDDEVLEVFVGTAVGAAVGAVLGALVVLVFWQGLIPFARDAVGLDLALGVSTFLAILCGVSGGIFALAHARDN